MLNLLNNSKFNSSNSFFFFFFCSLQIPLQCHQNSNYSWHQLGMLNTSDSKTFIAVATEHLILTQFRHCKNS